MNNLAKQETKHVALADHNQKWSAEEMQLLKNTVCKDANQDEFQVFCYAVRRTGLDPFMKQIHMVKRWNAKDNRFDMSIQVGVDGFRLIADRTGLYAGNEEPVFDDDDSPTKATVTVYKLVQGQRCAFKASARWAEYYPGDKMGFMWKKMPCVMLGKVAESLALRKAFPADLSGLYTNEEMDQAGTDKSGTAITRKPSEAQLKRLYAISHAAGMTGDGMKRILLSDYGLESSKDLSLDEYDHLCASLEATLVKFPSDVPVIATPSEAEIIEHGTYDPSFDKE